MPHFRKLSAAEIAALKQPKLGSRAQLARTYDGYLSDFAVGDYGQVELGPEERRGVVRSQLHAAAARRGLALRFRPGPRAALIFRVTPPQRPRQAPPDLVQQTPAPRTDVPPSEPAGRAARPRPRPRQTASERYQTVLPRWMRGKEPSGQQERGKRRRR
jgi:hypothetical protein